MNKKMVASLHTHIKSLLDADINANAFCDKLLEYGAEGFALTDHGSLVGIETVRRIAADKGLKFVPGVEAYVSDDGDVVESRHMILLAMDDIGYHAISMAVTDSNEHISVGGLQRMTSDILDKYFAPGSIGHGHVIMLSACVSGIFSKLLLYNNTVEHKVEILQRRQAKFGIPEDENYRSLLKKNEQMTAEIQNITNKRDTLQKLAQMRFAKREKYVQKLHKNDDPAYETEVKALKADKEKSAAAAKELESVRNSLAKEKKQQTAINQQIKEYAGKIERYNNYQAEINELKKEEKSEKELISLVEEEIKRMLHIFGQDNVYMEMQYHGMEDEKKVFPILAKMAKTFKIPMVATNDIHTITNNEDEILKRAILRSMRKAGDNEEFEEPTPIDRELYLKTDEELADMLSVILPDDVVSESIANIKVVLDRCNVEFKHENHYPKFPSKDGKTANEMLDEAITKGVKWRFPKGLDQSHKLRLKRELKVIKSMGYADYHLIVKDFLEYCRTLGPVPYDRLPEAPLEIEACKQWVKENKWVGGFPIGPGRGSAVGSEVCYILGITNIDPLDYDLLFERFLNPERVSMPDIDSDIAYFVREQAIRYVQHKYGENAVCGILTTNAQAPKGAIRIAAKYYGLRYYNDAKAFINLGDKIAKSVPKEVGMAFDSKVEKDSPKTLYNDLVAKYGSNEDAKNILSWAYIMENSCTAYGAHAAGIVISDNDNIKKYIPLRWNSGLKEWTTQCDMIQTEELGLLKMDFLGLRTLNIITDCIKSIYRRTGKIIDPLKDIPMNDIRVYQGIFQTGRTNSVFQFESPAMKSMLKRFKPECFEDLVILVSMFRPGPLQFIDDVINVKNGAKPTYLTPELEPILSKTYGAIVYQEQVMEILQKLAGYSLGAADQVRRYMSKKKVAKMEAERQVFIYGSEEKNIPGCVKNEISAEIGNQIYDKMIDFAKYAFNKSHAAAYATNSYYTGWLKYYYPADFLSAAMNWAKNEKIPGLMGEAISFGVNIIPPDINRSETKFVCTGNREILFGFSGIKFVANEAEAIVKERNANGKYVSVSDFLTRTTAKKNVVENLIFSGSFDGFGSNRHAIVSIVEPMKKAIKKMSEKEKILKTLDDKKKLENATKSYEAARTTLNSITIPIYKEDRDARMEKEKELLGAYVTESPLDQYPEPEKVGCTAIGNFNLSTTKLFGIVENLEIKYRKADGKPMAFFQLSDKTGSIKVSVFTRQFTHISPLLKDGAVIALSGSVHEEDTGLQDSEGMPIVEYSLYAEKAQNVPKELSMYYMEVSSYAAFHLYQEKNFIQKYSCEEDGHKLIIHDKALNEMRETLYKVSPIALVSGIVKEL